MTLSFKKIIPVLLLSTAFAGVTTSALAAAPEADAVRGPTGSSETFDLKIKVRNLVKFDQDIARKENAEKITGAAGSAGSEVKEMRQRLKVDIAATAPKILLSQNISEQDAASLIAQFPANFSQMPSYLTKSAEKIGFLHECQADILKPGFSADNATEALATSVASCIAQKKDVEPAAAPAENVRPAATVEVASQKPAPQRQPRVAPPPAPAPAPVQTAQPTGEIKALPSGIAAYMTPLNMGIGGGFLLAVVGGIGFAAMRRKKSDVTPVAAPVTTTAAPPSPQPEAPTDGRTVKLMDAPIKLKDGAAAPAATPKRRDISL